MGEDFPAIGRDFFRVDGNDDALAAKAFRAIADQRRRGESGGVDARLVGPGLQHRPHVIHGANAAADGEWHEAAVRHALDHVDHRRPAMRGGGDIKEDHFIRALRIIANGQFHGIAHVAQFARLGFAELNPTGDLAVVDIETGNDAFIKHDRKL
ncbi:MAG: hypothetical protein QM796_07495 [Chthoniobacteraceae bacterium]